MSHEIETPFWTRAPEPTISQFYAAQQALNIEAAATQPIAETIAKQIWPRLSSPFRQ